ncbi:LUD domain-containing protein [Nostocoides australiense]
MSAREEILARVRSATSDVTTEKRQTGEAPLIVSWGSASSSLGSATPTHNQSQVVELFAENVADYRATVVRVPAEQVAATVVEQLRAAGLRSVVVPTGLDAGWSDALGAEFDVLTEVDATSAQTLDGIDAVVTGAAIGIATTGTIVLDHTANQGRRELTLVPDTHVCVIGEDQVVHDVPEAVSLLRTPAGAQRALTWISGPSATSDIELQRVEGVHGPRTLIVVIAA